MRNALLLTLTLFLVVACGKDSVKEPDVPALITILNPIAQTIFLNGSTLNIRGNATDNNVLASVNCTIRNKNTSAVLYNRTLTTGNVGYFDFAQDWPITGITSLTPVKLTITTTDKVGYVATKEVDFELID
jgi:hypothetical protein